jgi:methyltransferase family protein
VTVRDDPLRPDPAFADLYAALPEADDLWPWLDWCSEAQPPVLYLGIGVGRLAAPLRRAGIELVGVDAHPGMLAHVRRRIPDLEAHEALIADLRLERRYDLVIGPSSILTPDTNLAAAVRHLQHGGRVGMELMNPHWLDSTDHDGVRIHHAADGTSMLEVDYRLPDGSVVMQVVENWRPGPTPQDTRERLRGFGLDLLWIGARPGMTLKTSPTFYALAGMPRRPSQRRARTA